MQKRRIIAGKKGEKIMRKLLLAPLEIIFHYLLRLGCKFRAIFAMFSCNSKFLMGIGFIFLSLFLPGIVSADGVIFPPSDYYVAETDQKAVLFYDQGIETLILSITFTGNAKDFAWVVPTPSRPEVDKSSSELFLSLEELTRLPRTHQSFGRNLQAGMADEKSAVEVLETKEVGIYEIKVLAASEAGDLAKWLSENGYQFPEKGSYILEDYIKNKWYYTAVKIRPEIVWKDVTEKLRTGQAAPLKLTFKSDKIIYPLKITSLTSLWQMAETKIKKLSYPEQEIAIAPEMPYPYQDGAGILLYVFDNCEKVLPGFNTQYAEIIEAEEIEDLAYDDQGKPWMKTKKDFVLTKLYRNMKFTEMNDDLILRDAKNGLKVPASSSVFPFNSISPIEESEDTGGFLENFLYSFIALIIWIISPVGLIFIICAFILFTIKSKFVRFLSWLGQGLAIFSWVSIMFWLIIARSKPFQENIFQLNKEYLDAGIFAGIILMPIMLIIILGEILYRRKIKGGETANEEISENS
jgi:hypothetical protein